VQAVPDATPRRPDAAPPPVDAAPPPDARVCCPRPLTQLTAAEIQTIAYGEADRLLLERLHVAGGAPRGKLDLVGCTWGGQLTFGRVTDTLVDITVDACGKILWSQISGGF
jgi:hypothetical protein